MTLSKPLKAARRIGSGRLHAQETRILGQILRELRQVHYQFITPTPATIARVNVRSGNENALNLAGALGWSRPFRLELLPRNLRDLMAEAELLLPYDDRFLSAIRVSTLGRHLYVHSAYPTVAEDSVFFGPDTYRFVAAVQARLASRPEPIRRAVDIGCGAGAGGIVVAEARPSGDVTMVDINTRALLYAAANAGAAGVTNVATSEGDLLSKLDGPFDLIVSNPPYLNDPLARAYRHGGGALGEALSVRIVEAALERLAPGGELILYTGVAMVDGVDPFMTEVSPMLRARDVAWCYHEVDPDVFGEELDTEPYRSADRIAAVVLTITNRGSLRC